MKRERVDARVPYEPDPVRLSSPASAPRPGWNATVAAAMLAAKLRPSRRVGATEPPPLRFSWQHRAAEAQPSKIDDPSGGTRSESERPDRRPSDIRLSQFYTDPAIAKLMMAIFEEHFDPKHLLMVEPSAGEGAFLALLPHLSLAFDVEPKHAGIEPGDFLSIAIESDAPIAIVGNPPYGRNSSLAMRFFNHAAGQSMVIAMILPRTFRKASIQNKLDRRFHLFREVDVPADAFFFRSKRQTVPAVFQIWIRADRPRDLWWTERDHADFDFTDRDGADFAIRRIGVNAGRIYRNPVGKPTSFYFIRGDVEEVMSKLDLVGVARDVAGVPSISMAEIVGLYVDWKRRNGEQLQR